MILSTAIAFDLLRSATGNEVAAILANIKHLFCRTDCFTSATNNDEICIVQSWNGIPLWGLTRLGPVEDYFINPDFLDWRQSFHQSRRRSPKIAEAGFDCIAIVCPPRESV